MEWTRLKEAYRKSDMLNTAALSKLQSYAHGHGKATVQQALKADSWTLLKPQAILPCKLTISSYLFARWHLLRHVGYLRHQQQVKLPIDLLNLKVVSESHVTWATSVPILVFLGLSVLDYARCTRQTDRRQTDVRQKHRLMSPSCGGGGIIKCIVLLERYSEDGRQVLWSDRGWN